SFSSVHSPHLAGSTRCEATSTSSPSPLAPAPPPHHPRRNPRKLSPRPLPLLDAATTTTASSSSSTMAPPVAPARKAIYDAVLDSCGSGEHDVDLLLCDRGFRNVGGITGDESAARRDPG
ncbi:unnamed protein product, partial [Urochloa humidicola]